MKPNPDNQPDLFSSSQESDRRHQNHFLFSDYYLEELLTSEVVWRKEKNAALQFLTWLQKLYADEGANLASYNEAQLEANWIQPILDEMGWKGTYETQATIPALTAKKIRKPDYVCFPSSEMRTAAVTRQNTETYANDAVVVGEAKRWGVALNKKQGGKPTFENNNPSYQIDYYLRATDVRWGVLTDGRYWRLVNKESSYKLDVYFEVDLHDVLVNESQSGILYFWLFFRQAGFVPDEQGNTFVEDALTASVNYAREVENDLRENAYKALEQLIEGFFAFGRNNLSADNPDHLETVYTNSLYLLYRLLFLLYGESRGLLPLRNKKYKEVSLTNLVNDVKEKLDVDGYQFSPFSRQYWARQQDLCHIINGTNPAANQHYGIPRYNGGLFSDVKHPFLETHVMGDAYLLRAIDYLARRDRHKKGEKAIKERVDYRTLGVRQLGSIYEGLLEYRPAKAAEPMVTIRRKGNEVWIPATERGKKSALERRETGELYLATDKGERKATGSYYTPDYIVRYIVEQTLQPLLDEIETAVEQLPEDERGAAYAERVLALNVLDPAMGSGHFLVAAAEYLALALTNYASSDPPTLPRVNGLSELERQAQEKNYWLRRVTEACIYGVDKNEMAVELAKLSLWLTTVAADKPLSFLDHHLRHGDSLVGARLRDLLTLPDGKRGKRRNGAQADGQASLLDEALLTTEINVAVERMMGIEQVMSDSVEAIHQKETLFAELRESVGRWRTLADVWVSSYFGNGMSPEEYADVARKVQGKATVASDEQLRPFIEYPAVTDNDYFHWELEFPEVFFDEDGRPLGDDAGFDVVIGNPPYTRVQFMHKSTRQFISSNYQIAQGAYDLYIIFVEQGSLNLLNAQGQFGYIVPNKFYKVDYGEGLREILSEQRIVSKLIDFGSAQVFGEAATTYTTLVFISKRPNGDDFDYYELRKGFSPKAIDNLEDEEAWEKQRIVKGDLSSRTWNFHASQTKGIHQKLHADSDLLGQLTAHISRGISTGQDKVFVVKGISQSGEIVRVRSDITKKEYQIEKGITRIPIFATDFGKYQFAPKDGNIQLIWPYDEQYVLYSANQLSQQFPLAMEYLTDHRELLESRAQYQQWYGFSAPRGLENHDNGDLLIPLMANSPIFTAYPKPQNVCGLMASGGFSIGVADDTLYDKHYILGLINSKLLFFYLQSISNVFRGGWITCTKQYFEQLPIKKLTVDDERYLQIVKSAQSSLEMCDQRGHIVDRFWIDMDGVTNNDVFTTLQKGKWQETVHKQIKDARDFVDEHNRSAVTLDVALGWTEDAFKGFVKLLAGKVRGMADLLYVYRTYHPDYIALTQKIAQTDALIDQLVYKLYDLTDDEIALIEAAE